MNIVILAGTINTELISRTTAAEFEVGEFTVRQPGARKVQEYPLKVLGSASIARMRPHVVVGAQVLVSAHMQTRAWIGNDGGRRIWVELVADRIEAVNGINEPQSSMADFGDFD